MHLKSTIKDNTNLNTIFSDYCRENSSHIKCQGMNYNSGKPELNIDSTTFGILSIYKLAVNIP